MEANLHKKRSACDAEKLIAPSSLVLDELQQFKL